jgi:hypothetical protein
MPINNDIKCISPATAQYHAERNETMNADFVRNFDLARNCSIEISSNETSIATIKNGDGEQPLRLRLDENSSPQVRRGVINNVIIDSDITVKHTSGLIPMGEPPVKDGAFGIDRVGSSPLGNTDAQKVLAKDSSHHKKTHTNPAGPHTLRQTKDLAMQQTVDGRRVLYSPGSILIKELSTAASVLHQIVSNLSTDSQITIGARILGEEGLLDGETIPDLVAALQRVSTKNNSSSAVAASATDRAAVIALMGDIGVFYSRPADAKVELMTELNSQLTAAGLHVPEESEMEIMRRTGGSRTVGPDKKAERSVVAFDSRADIPLRAGIHNMGLAADEVLGIAQQNRIPVNRWPVFDISRHRINETTEPLTGHMSGSPAEILQTWDMLCGLTGEDQYVGALTRSSARQEREKFLHPMSDFTSVEQAQRYARAAGASAFLVGLGYHSTVEVLEGILVYTGQNIRTEGTLSQSQRDAAHLFGHGAATDLITELFITNTARQAL